MQKYEIIFKRPLIAEQDASEWQIKHVFGTFSVILAIEIGTFSEKMRAKSGLFPSF